MVAEAEVIGDFKPGQFWKWKSDIFYEVESGISDPLKEGLGIVEIADVNNDKSMDLISISQDGKGFGVHYYMRDQDYYNSSYYSTESFC
jgi:hypothetical protein